jgi:hypothetical protein
MRQVCAQLIRRRSVQRVRRRGRVGQRIQQIGGGQVGNPLRMVGDAG